jgi:hypothetical protein
MKTKDLRLGNFIKLSKNNTVFIVDFFDEIGIGVHNDKKKTWIETDLFEPIELTKEWLLKFEFEYNENKKIYTKNIGIYINHTRKICVNIDNGFNYVSLIELINTELPKYHTDHTNIFDNDWYGHKLYVHTLQNIYFILTEKEL